ncbi:MAG: pyridoxamine 5'-phosphate oxidase family protein [Saprospiraceae bacterium]|nr:pyridoxamine 5'-phosphate oxidase family protein [Saprospiraceae bacterium]
MNLTEEIKKYIDQSVLCWLATSSTENQPNVSPKEVFATYKNDSIIIANIASPQTMKNIRRNYRVCISFIDILVQKGFQLKGQAEIIESDHEEFTAMEKILLKITQGDFPFSSIIKIYVIKSKPIIAPRYILYPDTTEAEQITNARRLYGL